MCFPTDSRKLESLLIKVGHVEAISIVIDVIHTERREKVELRKSAITNTYGIINTILWEETLVLASSWRELLAKSALYINRDVRLELDYACETTPSSV